MILTLSAITRFSPYFPIISTSSPFEMFRFVDFGMRIFVSLASMTSNTREFFVFWMLETVPLIFAMLLDLISSGLRYSGDRKFDREANVRRPKIETISAIFINVASCTIGLFCLM